MGTTLSARPMDYSQMRTVMDTVTGPELEYSMACMGVAEWMTICTLLYEPLGKGAGWEA